jgi:hypothetical protein
VPLLVHNNRPGREAELLERYSEPAWNNPVMRFFEGGGRELLPRRDDVRGTAALAERLVLALEAAGRTVPGYLQLVLEESGPEAHERAVFAMA